MLTRFATVAVVLCVSSATAAPKPKWEDHFLKLGDGTIAVPSVDPPRFAFTLDDVWSSPKDFETARPPTSELGWWIEKLVVAESADKQVVWLAANIGEAEPACGAAPCPPPPKLVPDWHGTLLLERAGTGWRYVAWHIAWTVTAQNQAKGVKAGKQPPPFARSILPGAEDVAKLFETTIADPKALAASVSKRKDVVLYGSEMAERYVGGAKVKSTLASWQLGLKVRDGLQAGVTSSKTVAWVAANVDATSLKRPKNAAVPYRVLFLYEKTAPGWQLVQAHFSYWN